MTWPDSLAAVTEAPGPAASDVADPAAGATQWPAWGAVFAVVWLVFLVGSVVQALEIGTPRSDAGAAVLIAFAAAYVYGSIGLRSIVRALTPAELEGGRRTLVTALVISTVLAAGAIGLLGVLGLDTLPYLAVMGSIVFRQRGGVAVLILTLIHVGAERGFGSTWDASWTAAMGTLAAGLSVWAFFLLTARNNDRVRAAQAESLLALEAERGRFARDLHDIVGHSLSVVTMKAGLARRLLETDPQRASVEIEEVERLSRHWRTYAARSAATGRSRCPVSWPRPGRCWRPPASQRICRPRPTTSTRGCGTCSPGPCGRA